MGLADQGGDLGSEDTGGTGRARAMIDQGGSRGLHHIQTDNGGAEGALIQGEADGSEGHGGVWGSED